MSLDRFGASTFAIIKVGMHTNAINRSPTDMLTMNEFVTVCSLLLMQNDATARKLPKNTAMSVKAIKVDIKTVRTVAGSIADVFAEIFHFGK